MNKIVRMISGSPARRIAAFVLAVVGFFSGVIAISEWLTKQPQEVDLVRGQKSEIAVTSSSFADLHDNLLQADHLIIEEDIVLNEGKYILAADRISFRNGAKIVAEKQMAENIHVILLASLIDEPTLNLTGASGRGGGRVTIRAGAINGGEIVANGGTGGAGAPGPNGANGRDGSCAGFGAWRPAEPGRSGARGGQGQDGGDSGQINIKMGKISIVSVTASAGKGGDGGVGGRGGAGGSGCTGLGGTQRSRSPGAQGAQGSAGRSGQSHPPSIAEFDYIAFTKPLIEKGIDIRSVAAAIGDAQ